MECSSKPSDKEERPQALFIEDTANIARVKTKMQLFPSHAVDHGHERSTDHQALDSFMASFGLYYNLDTAIISPSNDAAELKRKRCDIGEEFEGQEKGQKPGDSSEEETARKNVDGAKSKRKRKNVEKRPRISDPIPNEKDGESDETCTPSYRLLPEKEPLKKRLEGIINNQFRSEAPPHESRRRRIDEFEQFLFELEDKRYQLDMLHKRFISAYNTAWELLAETYVEEEEEEEEEEPVSAIEEDGEDDDKAKEAERVRQRVKSREDRRSQDVKFIELLYGEYGFDVVEAIRKIPRSALPVVITRLVKQLKKSRKFRKDHLKFKNYVLPQNL